jgi:hypothetical protein
MNKFLSLIAARLREPSTWVGVGSLVTAVGFSVAPELWKEISAVGMGVGGLLAVLMSEKGEG